MFIKLTAANQL